MEAARGCNLMIHNPSANGDEIILNPELFNDLLPGSLLRITALESPAANVIVRIQPIAQAPSGQMEVSLLKTIADAIGFKPFSRVILQPVSEEEAQVDFVELSFRKQFVRRGDMLRFKFSMVNRSIYHNQSLTVDSMQAAIQDIRKSSTSITSGVITSSTKFVFRSKSARIVWLVQISAEMWDMDPNGDMFFDKFVRDFAHPILNKWKSLGVSHMLTVVFFARTLYLDEKMNHSTHSELFTKKSLVLQDGLYMQDQVKVVIENVADIDKKLHEIISKLRSELWTFVKDCGWRIPNTETNYNNNAQTTLKSTLPSNQSLDNLAEAATGTNSSTRSRSATDHHKAAIACAVPSDATHGNLLEAINITLNLLDKHYLDRDLQRTGNSIVVISAGTGLFKVRPKIAMITKQRMLDNAIGIDCISLSRPPVHTVPLFFVDAKALYNNAKNFYEVPHWMKVSYLDCQHDHDSAMHLNNHHHKLLSNSQVMDALHKGWDAQWTKQILPHAYSAFLSSQLGYYTCLGIGGNKEMNIKASEAMIVLRETYSSLLPFALRSYLTLPVVSSGLREISGAPLVISLDDCTIANSKIISWGQIEIDFDYLNRTLGKAAMELHQRSTVWQREVTTNLRRMAKSPTTTTAMEQKLMLPDVFETLPALRRDDHDELQTLAASYGSNVGDSTNDQSVRSFEANCSHHGGLSHGSSVSSTHCSSSFATREGRMSDDRLSNLSFPSHSVRSAFNTNNNQVLNNHHRRGLYENILSRKQQLFELSYEEDMSFDNNHERLLEIIQGYDSAASNCCRPNHSLTKPPSTVDLHAAEGDSHSLTDDDEHGGNGTKNPLHIIASERRRKTSIDVEVDEDRNTLSTVFSSRHPSLHKPSAKISNTAPQPLVSALKGSSSSTAAAASAFVSVASGAISAITTSKDANRMLNAATAVGGSMPSSFVVAAGIAAATGTGGGGQKQQQSLSNPAANDGTTPASAAASASAPAAAATTTTKQVPKDPQAARLLNAAMNKNKMRKHVVQSLAASGLMQPPTQSASAVNNSGKSAAKVELKHGIATIVPDYSNSNSNNKQEQQEQELEDLLAYERRNSINPFRHHEGQKYLEMVTHNRRRWSHVFAQGRHNIRVDYSLNWKSLTQPAILPLNTDYLPSLTDLKARFTCDHYSFSFDDRDCPFASMEAALLEMVCTRLSHEYQLYQHFDKEAYLRAASRYDSITTSKDSLVFYVLTMGHRIHFIVGDTAARKILVTQYISTKGRNEEERKEGSSTDSDRTRVQCKYEIWSHQLQRFATISQTFALFPDEFLWNQLDTLILGTMTYDGVASGKKPRTIKYTIIPPVIKTEEEMDAYYNKIDLLMEALKKYIPDISNHNIHEIFPIQKDRTILNMSNEGNIEIQSKLAALYYRQTAKETENMLAVTRLMLHGYKQNNPNWIYIKHDRNIYSFKAFHLNLEWFACDSWSLDKFINELYRKCRGWGLRLVQTPSYFGSHNLNVHPLRPLSHIVVPMPSFTIPVQHCSPLRLVERLLFSSSSSNSNSEWVFDAERNTDWMAIGLSFPNYSERDRDILQEEALVNAVKSNTSSAQQATTAATAAVTTATTASTGGLSSLSDALRKLFPILRASSSSSKYNAVITEEPVTSYASPVGALSSHSGSFASPAGNNNSSGNLLGRAMLKRFDRQYVHQLGIATVRMTANGFLYMLSASARVSDLTIPLEERVELAKRLYRQLEERACIIVDIYELLIGDIFNQALVLVDQHEQARLDAEAAAAAAIAAAIIAAEAAITEKAEEGADEVVDEEDLPVAIAEVVSVEENEVAAAFALEITTNNDEGVPSASSAAAQNTSSL